MHRKILGVLATTALALALVAAPASAQQQRQRGLVNVAVGDVLVQVPVAIAANICDVNVAVLAQVRDDAAACDADAQAVADALPGGGNGSPNQRQEGLVNVALGDVTVQLPIGVAANVCDVNVAVLAELEDAAAACNAAADATAG